MQKSIVYDVETIKPFAPSKGQPRDPQISYVSPGEGRRGLGVSVVTCFVSEGFANYRSGIYSFLNLESLIPYQFPEFLGLMAEKPIVIGFNSSTFDDGLMASQGMEVTTSYDIFRMIKASVPKPLPGNSYALKVVAEANGLSKGNGALAPVLWQMGRVDDVVAYAREEMRAMVKILQKGLRGELIDPHGAGLINFPPTNLDIAYFSQELSLF